MELYSPDCCTVSKMIYNGTFFPLLCVSLHSGCYINTKFIVLQYENQCRLIVLQSLLAIQRRGICIIAAQSHWLYCDYANIHTQAVNVALDLNVWSILDIQRSVWNQWKLLRSSAPLKALPSGLSGSYAWGESDRNVCQQHTYMWLLLLSFLVGIQKFLDKH